MPAFVTPHPITPLTHNQHHHRLLRNVTNVIFRAILDLFLIKKVSKNRCCCVVLGFDCLLAEIFLAQSLKMH